MPYIIQLLQKGISIENTSDQTQKFLPCNTKIETTQNHIRFYAGARKEQDIFLSLAEIQNLNDQNGNPLAKTTLSDVFKGIVQNLCKCPNGTTQNNMLIPTPEVILNNFRGADSQATPRILKVKWEGESTEFLSHRPKIILERYKKRSKSKKNFGNKTSTGYRYTKKGFVHPEHNRLAGTKIITSEWKCPTTAGEYTNIDIESVFVIPFTKMFLLPKGQGGTNKFGNRKPPKFQRFRFKIEITKNGKKYYSDPSQIFAVGGNWESASKKPEGRYLQVFFTS